MAAPKSTAALELERTAHHEGAHAVVMIALGLGCKGVTVAPDYQEGTCGAAWHGGEYGRMANSPGEENDDVANLRVYAQDAFLLRHAIANYAGAEAARRWNPRRKDWKDGTDSDYVQATDRINAITQDAASIDLLFAYAHRRCTVLVEHYWPEIQAVAAAAMNARKLRLTGPKVQQIFRTSIRKRRAGHLSW